MTDRIVNLSDIHEKIAAEFYFTGDQVRDVACFIPGDAYNETLAPFSDNLRRITVCFLVLHNGFVLVGVSACVSIENFDVAKGRAFAREDALTKMWPVEGYLLMEKIHREKTEHTFGPSRTKEGY